METAIIVPQSQFIAPVTDMRTALQAYQNMKEFVSGVLHENVDFGAIPGTDKPTLLKPGAEKLARFFGMFIRLEEIVRVEDWVGADHNGEAFFFYRYKALALRGENVVAEGIGSCSSWEKKYRYRNADRVCPNCGQSTIFKSKPPKTGFYCWSRKGGCGAQFPANEKRITEQEVGKVINPDPADVVNTVGKMAQKRAIVAAVLLACNASEYFTQDVEDYIDASYVDHEPVVETQPAPRPTPAPQPASDKPFMPPTIEPKSVEPSASMSMESASTLTSGDGEKLVDLPTSKLAGMANSLTKGLKSEQYPAEVKEAKQHELDAILAILADRRRK